VKNNLGLPSLSEKLLTQADLAYTGEDMAERFGSKEPQTYSRQLSIRNKGRPARVHTYFTSHLYQLGTGKCNVADPGCLCRIPELDFSRPDPGSRSKIFQRIPDPDPHKRI
jgi:hypothetical protein